VALRVTLQEVVQAVRAECGLSTNTSRGIDHLDNIKQLIRRHYTTLAEDFDWQHLEIRREAPDSRKLLQAGSRYYNWPAALNPLKIEAAWVMWGNNWVPLDYGIGYREYNVQSSDLDMRCDPVLSWAFYGGEQFEVWPLPVSNGVANVSNEIAFKGQRKVEQLLQDTSRMDMDDILVSLRVSTEILAGQKKMEAASVKGDAAKARLESLRAHLASKTKYVMGKGRVGPDTGLPRHPDYIR
jgi:hypothetical protein